jgi:Amt family ammonium transporter
VFITSLIFWNLIKATIGIRVSAEEELEGLDVGEHGNVAYPDFVTVTARGAAIANTAGSMVQGSAAYPAAELSKRTV